MRPYFVSCETLHIHTHRMQISFACLKALTRTCRCKSCKRDDDDDDGNTKRTHLQETPDIAFLKLKS